MGNILLQYKDVAFESDEHDYGIGATVGIQGNKNLGLQYLYNQPKLQDEMAVCFAFPGLTLDCTGSPRDSWVNVDSSQIDIASDSQTTVEVEFIADLTHGAQMGLNKATLLISGVDDESLTIPVSLFVEETTIEETSYKLHLPYISKAP